MCVCVCVVCVCVCACLSTVYIVRCRGGVADVEEDECSSVICYRV